MTDRDLFKEIYPSISDEEINELEKLPEHVPPILTLSDIENTYITRYFVKNVLDVNGIIEVDAKQYSDFKENPRYVTTEVDWKIVGKRETIKQHNNIDILGTIDSNKKAVNTADLTFGGLVRYITNYSEFWVGES